MVNFKTLLDKATNPDHSDPDWESILEIVEEVKTKGVTVKNAVKEIRRKLLDPDPTVVYFTLLVLDSLMKNCASEVHSEVLSSEFMGVMKNIITSSKDGRDAKAVDKALELIGEWKVAFGSQSGYKAIHDVFGELEREGYHIPETEVASAAFIKKAPEWVMGERCFMCRQEFSKLKGNFRHHCRNCGKSVCSQCSSKRAALPHFGVDTPTRVCDLCFKEVDKSSVGKDAAKKDDDNGSDLPLEYLQSSLAHESQAPPASDPNVQLQEEDDLQLAIAMSLNEQENKKQTAPARSITPPPSTTPSAPPPPTSTIYTTIVHDTSSAANTSARVHFADNGPTMEPETDPSLARYLDRSYWEERREKQMSGATATPPTHSGPTHSGPTHSGNDLGPQAVALSEGAKGNPLADTIRKTIDLFLQRLQTVGPAGGSVATDPIVLSLYQNLNALQPQLLKQIDDIQQERAHQERILQKLNEAKQARVTLNSMRRKHIEKVKQQEKEQALLARMQMEQKLALLRQQKHEQEEYQQSLQQKRLNVMNEQRSEYEQQLQVQRDMERQQLIAQEQQVLQHQFGAAIVPPQMQPQPQMQSQPPMQPSPQMQHQVQPPMQPAPQPYSQPQLQSHPQTHPQPYSQPQPPMQPQLQTQPQYGRISPVQQQYGRISPVQYTQGQYEPAPAQQFQPIAAPSLDPTSLSMHTLSFHDPTQQAPPLPTKLDHSPDSDPSIPPPPYQPMSLQTDGAFQQPHSYNPSQFNSQPTSLLDTNLTSFQPSPNTLPQMYTSQPSTLVQPPVQQQPSLTDPDLLLGQQPPPPSMQPQSMVTQPQGMATQPQFAPPQAVQPQGYQPPPTQALPPQPQAGYGSGYQQPPMQQQYATPPQQFATGYAPPGTMPQGIGGLQRTRQESEQPLITFD